MSVIKLWHFFSNTSAVTQLFFCSQRCMLIRTHGMTTTVRIGRRRSKILVSSREQKEQSAFSAAELSLQRIRSRTSAIRTITEQPNGVRGGVLLAAGGRRALRRGHAHIPQLLIGDRLQKVRRAKEKEGKEGLMSCLNTRGLAWRFEE